MCDPDHPRIEYLADKPGDTPEQRARRQEIREAVIKAREDGDYDRLEHLTGKIVKDLFAE